MAKKVFLVLVVLVILIAAFFLAFQFKKIVGSSMEPAVKNRATYLTSKITYLLGQPKRSDIVVYTIPQKPDMEFIGRIVAIPNDTLKITEDGKVYLNGVILNEPYTTTPTYIFVGDTPPGIARQYADKEFVITQNEYLVLGDNRFHSSDSREYGAIKWSNIVGKLLVCLAGCK